MTNAKLIEEAEALCAAATQGPWRIRNLGMDDYDPTYSLESETQGFIMSIDDDESDPDIAFIARTRTLIPELVAALREARQEAAAEHSHWMDADSRITELETQLQAATERYEAANSCIDGVAEAKDKKIAELEARERERVEAIGAFPEWVQGPGIVGGILHMAERVADLEAECAKASEEADCLRDAIHSMTDPMDAAGEPTFNTNRVVAVRRLIGTQAAEIEKLEAKLSEAMDGWRLEIDCRVSNKAAVVETVKGEVEGRPTHEGNYLQRLRELCEVEQQNKRADALLQRFLSLLGDDDYIENGHVPYKAWLYDVREHLGESPNKETDDA